jgi:hypothetical protein
VEALIDICRNLWIAFRRDLDPVKIALVVWIAFSSFLSGNELTDFRSYTGITGEKKDFSKILRKIYEEVVELGKFPGDDFIKREFFIGPGNDDTYKDIHILILIQNVDETERMTIQVTYFQPSENNPTVKYAKSMKNISCLFERDKIDITKSDYDEKELKKFLLEVLRSIQRKKKLLKKIGQRKRSFSNQMVLRASSPPRSA